VTFKYDDERTDAFSEYRSGFEIRTTKRCSSIEITTEADHALEVRSYEFTYLDQTEDGPELLPPNAVSLLTRIRVKGHDASETEELPPLEFDYSRFRPKTQKFDSSEKSVGEFRLGEFAK
jgi:hypothetical protein